MKTFKYLAISAVLLGVMVVSAGCTPCSGANLCPTLPCGNPCEAPVVNACGPCGSIR